MESVVNRRSDNAIAIPSVTIWRRCASGPDDRRRNKGWWNWHDDMAEYCPLGGRSSVGRAPVCGTGGRGFEPRRSPQVAGGGRPFVPYTAAAPSRRSDAPLAQRQSNGLLIRRFWVRNPGGAPTNVRYGGIRKGALFCSSAEGVGTQRTLGAARPVQLQVKRCWSRLLHPQRQRHSPRGFIELVRRE